MPDDAIATATATAPSDGAASNPLARGTLRQTASPARAAPSSSARAAISSSACCFRPSTRCACAAPSRPISRSSDLRAPRMTTTSFREYCRQQLDLFMPRRREAAGRALGRFRAPHQLRHCRFQRHAPLRRLKEPARAKRPRLRNGRQPSLLPLDAAAGLSGNHQTPQEGRARQETPRAGRGSSSRSRSAPTWSRRARCSARSKRFSRRTRSIASITTSAKSPSKISSRCALRTRSSSRSGTATTCRTCRSRRPNRWASRSAAATTITPARCAT